MKHLPDKAWNRINALLDAAWDLEPEERSAFLDQACAGEPELREHVEALLRAEAEAPDFLEKGATSLAGEALADVAAAADESLVNQRVGPYRLVEEIGRGGMSRVYRAERADGAFEQEVAVKLLRAGLDTPAARQRFRLERHVLATLEHPHIARLLDGGLTDGGAPYLAMEYVEGQPITQYCDERRLPVRERLQLLTTVSEALQYAHRNLVVHRDLKPSNIFVTEDGRVKLLDFGIAKLVEAENAPLTVPVTRTGARPMTPAYAAPEQVRGEAVSTATDVYQLGVLSYELLTGHRPYRSIERPTFEVQQAVLNDEPTPPSTIVTEVERHATGTERIEVVPEAVSRNRGTSLDELKHTLHGDLNAIVLKALRKAPEQRYASVEAFAADVGRYLTGRPVEARSLTMGYRLRKFARRHRSGVATAAGIVVLVVGFIGALLHQQNETARQRDRVQAEAAKAEQVSNFLVSLFAASDPDEAQGEALTAPQLLSGGAERIEQLDSQPSVQAEMLEAIGRAQQGLGRYDTARVLLRRSLQLRRRAHGPEHPDVAQSLYYLANLFAETRDVDAAMPLYREALRIRRQTLGPDHPTTAMVLGDLSTALRDMGQADSAVVLARQALDIHRRHLASDHPDVIGSEHKLAYALRAAGEYDESETLYRRVLKKERTQYGPSHSQVATTHNDLAYLLKQQQDYADAEHHYREALTIRRSVYGPAHPRTLLVMQNLAGTLWKLEKYDEVEAVLRERVAALREHARQDSMRLGSALDGLARFLADRQRTAEALKPRRAVYDIYREQLGETNLYTVCQGGKLGALLKALGQDSEADSLLDATYTYLQTQRDHILQQRDNYTRLDTEYAIRHMVDLFEQNELANLTHRYQALLQQYTGEPEA